MSSSNNNNAEILKAVLHNLSDALVYSEANNIETNKKLWNEYAKNWNKNREWLIKMANQVDRNVNNLKFIGEEWSNEFSLNQTLNEFLFPLLKGDTMIIGEIGVGG